MITPDDVQGWVGILKNPSILGIAGLCIYYLYRELNLLKEENKKLREENKEEYEKLRDENDKLHIKIEELLKDNIRNK